LRRTRSERVAESGQSGSGGDAMGSNGKIFLDMLLSAGCTGYTGACGACMLLRCETSRTLFGETDMDSMDRTISFDTLAVAPMGKTAMALEKELSVYEANLPELLANEGKYVLIAGEQISGPFDTYEDALAVGYEKYGLIPFLVKQISHFEPIYYFSRDLSACPS
jgi:hypothetical protein